MFDGNGNWTSDFSAQADRDNGIKILASRFDNIFIADIKESFENCLTKDGQIAPIGNFNMGGQKITNVGNGTNDNDAVNMSQLNNAVHKTGNETISGTKTFLAKTSMAPIELYPVSSGGPYIDFHYNNSTSDYTSRIIEQASGDLVVTTNNFTINANGYARASDVNGSILTTVNKSKAANGYFKLGNGLIIQWGRASGTITSSNMTITFPTPFTSASSYSVSGNVTYNSATDKGWGHINSCTSTSFKAVVDNDEKPFNWIAIGY